MNISQKRRWNKRLPLILTLLVVTLSLFIATIPHTETVEQPPLITLSTIDIYGIETIVTEENGIKTVRLPTENCTPLSWDKSKFRCDREIMSFVME